MSHLNDDVITRAPVLGERLSRNEEMNEKQKDKRQKPITDFIKKKAQCVVDSLCDSEPDEAYWRVLAEEREKALNTTLEENSDLSEILVQRNEEVEQLKTEKEELVEENEVLRLKSQKIDELAEILDELVCESSSSSL